MNQNYGTVTPIFCHQRKPATPQSQPAGRAKVIPISVVDPAALLLDYKACIDHSGSVPHSERESYIQALEQHRARLRHGERFLKSENCTVAAVLLRGLVAADAGIRRYKAEGSQDGQLIIDSVTALVALEMRLDKYINHLHESAEIMQQQVARNE
ncbi:MAG: hypothetical protein OIF57_05705 [Marinobacterium sp.]|nr:hypothetical protein [Marinobacterium sp.]